MPESVREFQKIIVFEGEVLYYEVASGMLIINRKLLNE